MSLSCQDAELKAAAEAKSAAESESERLHAQMEFDSDFLVSRSTDIESLEAAVYAKTSWDKYLECNPLPDVSSESSLNTYLSMWREDDSESNPPNIRYKPLIDSCSTTERVVDLLEEAHAEAREEIQLPKCIWVTRFAQILRNLVGFKIDLLTAQFLARYDEYENHETRVMNVCHNTPDIAFGLWVHNTAKRADGASVRVKRIEFPAIGFTMELPAALQKSRTSIRVVRTLFDHTSVASDASKDNSLVSKMKRASLSLSGALLADSSNSDPRLNSEPPPELPPFEKDINVLAKQADEIYAACVAAQVEAASASANSMLLGGASHLPPPVNFVSVGGIISIEQLALPPPPKKAKGWVMRDITALSKTIQIVPYPAASEEGNAANAAAAASGPGALAGGTSQAPMRVSFMLPAYVFLDDREPHFGWWDARHSVWRQEGVSLTRYEPRVDGGLVHLSLTLLKPVAIIQPRALDFPYRTWHLKPAHTTASVADMVAASSAASASDADPNAASAPSPDLDALSRVFELSLAGSRFSVEFEVGEDHARLLNPISPVLAELNSSQMLPGILLNRMARAGINVQPTVEDAAYCRKPLKSLVLTAALHEHLALVAPVFEIAGSPFNSSRSTRKCLVRVRLAKDSLTLAAAAQKRRRIDEEQRLAAEQRAKEMEAATGGAPDTTAASANTKAAADMAAMIAAMEADPAADKIAAEQRAIAEAKAAEAAALAEADGPSPAQIAAAQAKRSKLADEWVTVLVELAAIEAPPVKKIRTPVQLFSQDRTGMSESSTAQATPAATRPATAAASGPIINSPPAAELAPGTIAESTPGGVSQLLKFTLIRGVGLEGSCDERPLSDCVSHFSLRRCLLAYFIHLTDKDLTTALDMQLSARPPMPPSLRFLPETAAPAAATIGSPIGSPLASPTTAQAAAHAAALAAGTLVPDAAAQAAAAEAAAAKAAEESLPNPSFLLADVRSLQIQQTIRRMLNLTNVFTFH